VQALTRLFPPGPGRDLVVNKCGNCHSLAPVVINVVGMDYTALWANMFEVHLTGYVTAYGVVATEPEMELIFQYLLNTFVGMPVPDVPQSWIERWTYY